MLIKFTTQSNRVKGLSFHPKRPWILASLHDGHIHLYDYRMKTIIETFSEHEGPVRSVDFHRSQPLFVSGGDDYKVKVWNYKLKRCLFTLQGHLDYIRTVEFHTEQPWIISSSDDYTIRIWNWQSRQCIAVLTGHNYYVMCASFHPTKDLVVSASLDQTVRVWDISGLRKQGSTGGDDFMKIGQLNQELFGSSDVMVKYILEGHERGVNWAAFHPTQDLIVSASDDKTVRLWKFSASKAWESDVLMGHTGNVSCAKFHAKRNLLITNSEDRTMRIYNTARGNAFVSSYQREHDRFWIIASHPTEDIVAAGHDHGLLIYKMHRERLPTFVIRDHVYYFKDEHLRLYDCDKHVDSVISKKDRETALVPRTISHNPQENATLLVSGQGENSVWELYATKMQSPTKRGKGLAASFIGLRKYVVLALNKSKLQIYTLGSGDDPKEIDCPVFPVDNLFQAASGRIILRTSDKLHLYDFEQQLIIAEVSAVGIKHVFWSDDMSLAALIGKHSAQIVNNRLEPICSLHETVPIKGGAFDDMGVFIYTTLSHMKYCLPNGDTGTIKTLKSPLYILRVKSNAIYFMDREGQAKLSYIDATEYKFKMALLKGQLRDIHSIIGNSKILGDSIIAYLQQKGYPEIAMKFVQDDQTKFDLAIESGDIDSALAAAQQLDKKECWQRLAVEALKQGNYRVVEVAYQRTKDFEKLSFLYLTTGNVSNLQKMLNIAQMRGDNMSRFHNALFLGDVEHRVKVMLEVGQTRLAYVTAKTHGLDALAENIQRQLDDDFEMPELEHKPSLLMPPIPILKHTSWPLLDMQEGTGYGDESVIAEDGLLDTGAWGEQLDIGAEQSPFQPGEELDQEAVQAGDDELGGGWEGLDEINVGTLSSQINLADTEEYVEPTPGKPLSEYWTENSAHPADHVASGSFDSAMQLLNQSCAVVNFAPLKQHFMSIFTGAQALMPIAPQQPPFTVCMQRNMSGEKEDHKYQSLPLITGYNLTILQERHKQALMSTTRGHFEDAMQTFREILCSLLFVIIANKKEEKDARDLARVCGDYTTALRLELERKTTRDDPVRSMELAAYFTKCKLNGAHITLSLNSAMTVSYKSENFQLASDFAKRLLKMTNVPDKMLAQARFVIQKSEGKTDKHELNYDARNPFVLCSRTMTPIYAGSKFVSCGYCQATYLPEYQGQTCAVCEISEVGKDCPGLSAQQQQQQQQSRSSGGISFLE